MVDWLLSQVGIGNWSKAELCFMVLMKLFSVFGLSGIISARFYIKRKMYP